MEATSCRFDRSNRKIIVLRRFVVGSASLYLPLSNEERNIMNIPHSLQTQSQSRLGRFFRFPLVRIVLAAFCVALAAGLAYSLAEAVATKPARIAWPHLLATAAVVFVYWGYLRLIEARGLTEFSLRRAVPELVSGLAIGAGAMVAVMGLLSAIGIYHFSELNPWSVIIILPVAEMIFVSVFEEILCRAIIFRIVEQSLGSRAALVISALLFGLAHLPGAGMGVLAFVVAMVAGLVFSLAFMLTRRLWLCVGIHAAWNYTLGSIFSIAVSGHPAHGLFNGALIGPDWITGGIYGLEGSVVTLLVLGAIGVVLLRGVVRKGQLVAYKPRAAMV